MILSPNFLRVRCASDENQRSDHSVVFDAGRAEKTDLIMLPDSIPGTNCGNCEHFENGFCNHEKVNMNVNKNWCCFFWARPDALRAKKERLTPKG